MLCLSRTSTDYSSFACNHPDSLCETCYQKVTSCPLCRAPLGPTDDSDVDEANQGMLEAAEAGHEDIVRQILSRGANNYNEVLTMTARRGYESFARLMIDRGATNYNHTMSIAAQYGCELL